MSGLEEQMLDGFEFRPLVSYRFIDDAFFIWIPGCEKLGRFVD